MEENPIEIEDFTKKIECSYSKEEISALQGIFSLYDTDNSGFITPNDLNALLYQIVRTNNDDDDFIRNMYEKFQKQKVLITYEEIMKIAQTQRNIDGDGRISFSQFIVILLKFFPPRSLPDASPNKRTIQFLLILEDYRLRSESEGNYLEAHRIETQLNTLRHYEESRQQNAILAQQIQERLQMEQLHKDQYAHFESSWDQFTNNFEKKAHEFMEEMIKQHGQKIIDFQQKLQQEILSKPPKWSRELLEWRKRQHILAKQKNYAEAQKVKAISDALERQERSNMNLDYSGSLARKEANLRSLQIAERNAFEKKIEMRRKELNKKRKNDCRRLNQRNKNLMASLELKQNALKTKLFSEIKTNMTNELKSVQLQRQCVLKNKNNMKIKTKKTKVK